jgi:hypothetical protein
MGTIATGNSIEKEMGIAKSIWAENGIGLVKSKIEQRGSNGQG